MVSWNDDKTSEDSSMNLCSSCDGIIKLPATIDDPNFNGIDPKQNVLCEHGKPVERFATFEGMHMGRRFLGCAEKEGINYGFVQWIDFEWPDSMEKALAKLWDMYEESKATRTSDNLESSFLTHNPTEEKKKLQENYENLYDDVNALLDQQQRAVDSVEENNLKSELSKKGQDITNLQKKYDVLKNLTAARATIIRNLKNNHLKKKERLTEERKNLQYHISELQKTEKKMKLKIQGVKAILDGE